MCMGKDGTFEIGIKENSLKQNSDFVLRRIVFKIVFKKRIYSNQPLPNPCMYSPMLVFLYS